MGRTTSVPLQHTCELAAIGIQKRCTTEEQKPLCMCQYTSTDPAEGQPDATEQDVPSAAALLEDISLPLYDRYEGLFTLRNAGGPSAATALGRALLTDTSSAVLRHEVAFVLGQMEEKSAADALAAILARKEEHAMVRHEAAIALGPVAVAMPKADAALRAHLQDPDHLVAQSCEVALDTAAYWRAWEALEARLADGTGQ